MTQRVALDILKTGCNVYLTGSAGSGKTFVLNSYIDYLRLQGVSVGVTASTGVAATHLNGMTINSWAGIGIKKGVADTEIVDLLKRKYLHKRFKEVKVLIIDEISMLPSHTLEAVDSVLKAFKRNQEPFGGMQVVLCGDFFQLPPIDKNSNLEPQNPQQIQKNHAQHLKDFGNSDVKNVNSIPDFRCGVSNLQPDFIYKSPIWEVLDLKVCYLDKPYRQDDAVFLRILHQIRTNSITRETWATLRERFFHSFRNGVTPTRLYTHNMNADRINREELAKIKEEEKHFPMEWVGSESLAAVLKKSCLAPEELVLKKKALVMFVKNNYEAGYVNGTMGRVIDFTEKEGYPIVKTFAGKVFTVTPAEWEIDEANGEVKAKVTQIPLRLAWAITIHKSQGMSLDAAEIDLGKSFVAGMGYVALSRVRTLGGIRLRSINRTALTVNDEVIEIDKKLRELSAVTDTELQKSYWYQKNATV